MTTFTPTVSATPRPTSGRRRRRLVRVPLWFLLPGVLIYGAVVLIPSFIGAGYSFTDRTTLGGGRWTGLDNYSQIFRSSDSIGPLVQTLEMAAAVTVLQNVLGLLLALALNSQIKSRNWLRVLFFAPFVVSPLVSGYLWKYLLAPDGAVNRTLGAIGLHSLERPWLGDPNLALWSLVFAVVWQFTGSSMVIYLAGLQGVPQEVVEAAAIDGAGPVRRFWSVIRPFLAPALVVNLTLSLIAGLRLYDQIVAMTNGGPGGSTDSLSTVIYRTAFEFGQFGLGAAMAVVLTVLVIILSALQYLGLKRQASA